MKLKKLPTFKLLLLTLAAFSLNTFALADTTDSTYSSTVGLLTTEGPTGMFLNPTSGTPKAGTLKAQVCGATLPRDSNLGVYQLMTSYALTDYLEVGALWVDASPNGDTHFDAVGPQARLRVNQESKYLPEVSVGSYIKAGDNQVSQETMYSAASKFFELDKDGIFKRIGIHGGFKYLMQNAKYNDPNGAIGYTGAELALPNNIFLVGEVSLKDDVYKRTPYSYGMQVRHPSGIGFSLAGVQTGFETRPGIFIGVGINLLD